MSQLTNIIFSPWAVRLMTCCCCCYNYCVLGVDVIASRMLNENALSFNKQLLYGAIFHKIVTTINIDCSRRSLQIKLHNIHLIMPPCEHSGSVRITWMKC